MTLVKARMDEVELGGWSHLECYAWMEDHPLECSMRDSHLDLMYILICRGGGSF